MSNPPQNPPQTPIGQKKREPVYGSPMLVPRTGDDPVTSCFSETTENAVLGIRKPETEDKNQLSGTIHHNALAPSTTESTTAIAELAIRFLRFLHGDQAGYIEIVAGETDPADSRKIQMLMPTRDRPDIPNTREWFYLDPGRPDLYAAAAAYAGQLAAEHGNVYTSIRTYRSKSRSEKNVNPGRVIFVDDAPAAPLLPYSACIRTSSASRHAYYKCDAPVSKDDVRRAAAALGGDPSGVDLTQLVRFPGTLNTKRGERWPVELEVASGSIYTLDQVRAAFPAVAGSSSKISGTSWGDAYHAENWQNLPDGALLWRSAYIAAAAKRRPDLAKLLRGGRVTLIKKDDTRDDSDSAQVAALAYNLLSADVCKLQARAIADYLYPQIRPSKSREHYRAHFDAELERYTPKHYRSQTIRAAAPAGQQQQADPQPLPPAEYRPEPKSRARKDRPQRVSGPAGYLTWLRSQVDPQSGSVMLSQSQCAERIGCNIRTIKRYEKALGGQIERRIFAQRQAGCLFILASDVVTTSPDDVVIAATEAAQQNAENAESATVQDEHTAPPVTGPAAALPPAAELVSEAFDALDGCRRITLARIQQYLAMNYPQQQLQPAQLAHLVSDERARRRYAKTDAREARKAAKMRFDVLQRRSRALASQAAAVERAAKEGTTLPAAIEYEFNGKTYKTRVGAKPTLRYAGYLRHLAGIYAAEESRRQPAEAEPTTHELWAEVDQQQLQAARKTLKLSRRGLVPVARALQLESAAVGDTGARVSLQTPAPAGAGSGRVYDREYVVGMYARLRGSS